jgi:hypothetical protein
MFVEFPAFMLLGHSGVFNDAASPAATTLPDSSFRKVANITNP